MTKSDSREIGRRTPTPAEPVEDARTFAMAVARIASANKAENVSVLDLRGLSYLTDYFVIGTGTSSRQMHAVFEHVKDHARDVGRRHFGIGDSSDASWLLADYVDVVVHLFDEEHRDYYDLDGLWGDAPVVEWNEAVDVRPGTGDAADDEESE